MRHRLLLAGVLAFVAACGTGEPLSLEFYDSPQSMERHYRGSGADLRPPPAGASHRVSPDQAMQTYKKSGVFPDAAAKAAGPPDVSLVSFSDNEQGDVKADGSVKLKFQGVLAWAIVFHDVPWTGLGGGPAPAPGAPPALATPVLEDVVIIVDANSGELLTAFADVPETVGATPGPGGKSGSNGSGSPTPAAMP